MQGDPEIIELLNEVLTAELTAVNQYFVDAKMLDHWGVRRLAGHFRETSIGEMKDADRIIERVLFLDGTPNMQRLGPVKVGETPQEKLELALDLEREAIRRLNQGIGLCDTKGDHGTKGVLEEILHGEEAHADWLESQHDAIRVVGLEAYLAQQLHA